MLPALQSETADVPVVPSGTRGVVVRQPLLRRLQDANRVVQISAPAGSGKTVLLQSWICAAGLADSTAWVAVEREEHDPQQFWISLIDALRRTAAGSKLVRPLSAAPELNGWAVVERLLEDLSELRDRLWLVIDDLHQLHSDEAQRQLELLLMRAPGELRVLLASRRGLRLGLHRLRLEGELTEIRAADLGFSLEEARMLLDSAGVQPSESALALLHERTEGWAAGLRLAALSLAEHPDPERFAAEFTGSEPTVAEYLLAELLDRQSEPVRRLLLRTSVLERVNGELADLLTGEPGGERILQELEEANAFVVSVDRARSWFRYHPLFADLLQLQLRSSEAGELPRLHRTAALWYAEHGYPIEAVRHAQVARNGGLAARLQSGHWLDSVPSGQGSTGRVFPRRLPASAVSADTGRTALPAANETDWGWSGKARQQPARAAGRPGSLPADRRGRVQILPVVPQHSHARRCGDLPAAEEVQRLFAFAEDLDRARRSQGDDLRALDLISLGIGELWTGQLQGADRHLEQGVALANRIGWPFLELEGLAQWALVASERSLRAAAEQSTQAIELARQHGWRDESVTAVACAVLGNAKVWQGQLEEAEPWLDRAERTLQTQAEPAAAILLYSARGTLKLAHGHEHDALAAFRTAERLTELLVSSHPMTTQPWAGLLLTLLRLAETERVEAAVAGLDSPRRETAEMRTVLAALRLAQDRPQAAADALVPVLDGTFPVPDARPELVQAFLLEAITRDALGDTGAARYGLERALQIAEPDRMLLPFLLHPAPRLLEQHRRSHTTHTTLISQILNLLTKTTSPAPPPARTQYAEEPLTHSEIRVLRYLPSHLTAHEIARQLYLSVHTVTTHMRHIYSKLGVHRRHEAVERARALGLLATISRIS